MRQKLIHILIISGFGTTFYINSLDNFFVWNDWTLIIENFLIKDWQNLPEIFSSAFWKPLLGEPFQIYRPLVSMSFMMDFSLWGLKPWGYHLTNISLHVFNSILVYFLMRIYVSPVTAFMGSVLFVVHPIHTEDVTYISGRGELLMSLFLLSGMFLFLMAENYKSWSLYLASLPVFFFALLAKETAAIFPLMVLAAELAAFPSSWKNSRLRQSARHIGPLLVLASYYLLRNAFVGMTVSGTGFTAPGFFDHLFLTLKAIPLYLGLLLFPWNLHFLHPLGLASPLDFLTWLSVLLLGGVGWVFRYAIRAGNWTLAFALSWFFVGLLPLVYFIGFNIPLLEGWIYLPSLVFSLLAAAGLDWLQSLSRSRLHLWFALFLAVVLGALTFHRSRSWKDEMTIALDTRAASPTHPVALRLLGNAYFRYGRVLEAETILQEGLRLAPGDPRLHESLGRLYSFLGKDQEALERYQRMRELAPNEPYPYWQIGRYYFRRNNLAGAEAHFEKAVRLFPHSSELRNDLAQVYYLQGKLDASRAQIEEALRISPYSRVLKSNLDRVLSQK